MLKGRSLKSCVALAVFCCFLVVACISPAWAATTSGDPDSFAVYASFSGGPPATYDSKPVVVPFSGSHVFLAMTPNAAVSVNLMLQVPEIVPVDFDRTLVMDIGLQGNSNISVSDQGWKPVIWYKSGRTAQTLEQGSRFHYQDVIGSASKGRQFVVKITIPALATSFMTAGFPALFNFTGDGSTVGVTSFGGYVVDSGDPDVVDVVTDILAQVKQINSNTATIKTNVASSLTALNSILTQCKNIKADTASIITILNAVKSQLVTLNGKVDDIYTLLKDSLVSESAEVDKKSQELGDQIMQRVDSEQYWSDKNTENFEALDMGNWSFADGVVGALPTVGNLFKGLWDSIGEATLIFIFPLMLGIALVIVGRISRTSGKGHKQGGGDSG